MVIYKLIIRAIEIIRVKKFIDIFLFITAVSPLINTIAFEYPLTAPPSYRIIMNVQDL